MPGRGPAWWQRARRCHWNKAWQGRGWKCQEELLKGIARQRQGQDGRAPHYFLRKSGQLPSQPACPLPASPLDSLVHYGFINLALREMLLLQSTPCCWVGLMPSTGCQVNSNHWAQEELISWKNAKPEASPQCQLHSTGDKWTTYWNRINPTNCSWTTSNLLENSYLLLWLSLAKQCCEANPAWEKDMYTELAVRNEKARNSRKKIGNFSRSSSKLFVCLGRKYQVPYSRTGV